MFGAIELGGTKIVCGVSTSENEFIETIRIDTHAPGPTLLKVIEFFDLCEIKHGRLQGLGVASFGPVDLNTNSSAYGSILSTPKAGWSNFPLLNTLKANFSIPITITTDVNAALLAELKLGAARGIQNAVYVTIGTGIGAGITVNGDFVEGFLHPEIGHMRVPTQGATGNCPFHNNCLEGLASGPAIAARAGKPADQLAADDPILDAVASNLADMCNNLLVTLATERIVLGGGVMSQPMLLGKIKTQLELKLNSYLPLPGGNQALEQIIVAAQVQSSSGLLGALIMAQQTASYC